MRRCLLAAGAAASLTLGTLATAQPYATRPFGGPYQQSIGLSPHPASQMPDPQMTVYPVAMLDLPSAEIGCESCGDWRNPFRDSGPQAFVAGACTTCGGGPCVPGQSACSSCSSRTRVGRFVCGVYEALCCPDPCYDPHWIPLGDASFFCETARPVTQQRLRWDAGLGAIFPDRAEFFWPRADGGGKGPAPVAPYLAQRSLTYHELSLYTETSSGNFAFFLNQPYRSIYPEDGAHTAGFGAMDLGTKTLLFDCELLQVSFQFRTYMPMGTPNQGLGNGHTSLEPSLIIGLYLAEETYLQAQVAEWIPIAGDSRYAGAVLHSHLSLNHVMFRPLRDVPLIGTFEVNSWSFQDGAYTDPLLGTRDASRETYLSLGAGLRLFVCNRLDFGVGALFAATDGHLADKLIRSEFRWRF